MARRNGQKITKKNPHASGRPLGRPNRMTAEERRRIGKMKQQYQLLPLEFMLNVLNDEGGKFSFEEKRWAAQHAAPYLHPRLNAIEHSGEITHRRHEDWVMDLAAEIADRPEEDEGEAALALPAEGRPIH